VGFGGSGVALGGTGVGLGQMREHCAKAGPGAVSNVMLVIASRRASIIPARRVILMLNTGSPGMPLPTFQC
jgi:hypothetical protein